MLASYISPSNRRFASALNSCVLTSPSVSAFTPLSLFSGGVQGVWYDPSDLTTMFEDSAGTTAVHTPGNGTADSPVGLLLDKSQGLTIGPELTVNGDFATDTNWTKGTGWTISGGTANLVCGPSIYPIIYQNYSYTAGTTYKVSFTVSNYVSGYPQFLTLGGRQKATAVNAAGTYTFYFAAVAGDAWIGIQEQSGNAQYSIDNISVKAVAGNHATQSTSTKRPTLSAKYNVLIRTEDFNVSWTGYNTSVITNTNETLDPLGGSTANKIYSNIALNIGHQRYQIGITLSNSTSYTGAVYLKQAEYSWGMINLYDTIAGNKYGFFDLQNGTIGTVDSGCTASITSVGNGWYLCRLTRTTSSTSGGLSIEFSNADNGVNFAAAIGSGIYAWGADLRVSNDGVGLPAYQRVVNANTYDSAGFPYYLKSDGVDDGMVTGNIDFSAVNLVDYFPAVRKLNAGIYQCVFETSSNSGTNNGSFSLFSYGAQTDDWNVGIRGTSFGYSSYTPYVPPKSAIIAASLVIGSNAPTARINGAAATPSLTAANSGTGSLGTYPLYLMSRAVGSLFFEGRIYGLIIRGAASTAAQISNTETWLNGKAKIY